MKIKYRATIENPETHILQMAVDCDLSDMQQASLDFFLPVWSPGSYLVREYSRHLQKISATGETGAALEFIQLNKNSWRVYPGKAKKITFSYEVYCFEVSVRTSFIDHEHAFLHGPSYLVGVAGYEQTEHIIEYKFTPAWSKISTALDEISQKREEFIFRAENYDELIDSPVEIGCHETDGFQVGGKDHHLAFFGPTYEHNQKIKQDIKTIVQYVSDSFQDIPYEKYLFITHFLPNFFGGLEHLDSTALHFDGRKLNNRKDYINWLCLVSHEYFHTWNVKRIRPVELGPFNYTQENYTRMHWLTEGLTSFMDELNVYRCGLMTLEEYLDLQKDNLNRYLNIPGRLIQSVEDSSFNTWIKLYRPDENSVNSLISYYLKGALCFMLLHFEFKQLNKDINGFIKLLWDHYKQRPEKGLSRDEVFNFIKEFSNQEILDKFDSLVSTTIEPDFNQYFLDNGMKLVREEETDLGDLGMTAKFVGEQVFAASVRNNSALFKSGFNGGDEIIAVNDQRVTRKDFDLISNQLLAGKLYKLTFSRNGTIQNCEFILDKKVPQIKTIEIVNEEKVKKVFGA